MNIDVIKYINWCYIKFSEVQRDELRDCSPGDDLSGVEGQVIVKTLLDRESQ